MTTCILFSFNHYHIFKCEFQTPQGIFSWHFPNDTLEAAGLMFYTGESFLLSEADLNALIYMKLEDTALQEPSQDLLSEGLDVKYPAPQLNNQGYFSSRKSLSCNIFICEMETAIVISGFSMGTK